MESLCDIKTCGRPDFDGMVYLGASLCSACTARFFRLPLGEGLAWLERSVPEEVGEILRDRRESRALAVVT